MDNTYQRLPACLVSTPSIMFWIWSLLRVWELMIIDCSSYPVGEFFLFVWTYLNKREILFLCATCCIIIGLHFLPTGFEHYLSYFLWVRKYNIWVFFGWSQQQQLGLYWITCKKPFSMKCRLQFSIFPIIHSKCSMTIELHMLVDRHHPNLLLSLLSLLVHTAPLPLLMTLTSLLLLALSASHSN